MGTEIASGGEDDGYQSPVFDLSSDDDEDLSERVYNPNAQKKKRRVEEPEVAPAPIDLEALALRALGKR